MDARRLLLELFDGALRAVDGHDAVQIALRDFGESAVELFAVGKAAGSMTRGAHAALGDRIRRALVITRDGHVGADLANKV